MVEEALKRRLEPLAVIETVRVLLLYHDLQPRREKTCCVSNELRNCFTVNYMLRPGSQLNPAEIEIGIVARQWLSSRRTPELKTVRREVRALNRRVKHDRVKINWQSAPKAARSKFGLTRPKT
jgi:hypothetical protein